MIEQYISEINRNLKFTANAIVEGFISGLHKSPYHGFSVEFSDHKAYSSGDSVSLIDWKLYSRTERYYIKRYEEETNVRTYFLLDCSQSMNYYSRDIKKIDYARLFTACLINLSLRQRDATGLVLFNDNIISSIPAKSKNIWLNQCLTTLEHINCQGETNIADTVFKFSENIKKRSLIVIITDFLDDIEKIQKTLNYLKFNRHHCILFQIIDQAEREFLFKDEADFIDLETGEVLKVSPWILRKEYLNRFDMFNQKLKKIIEQLDFEYCQINTNTPIINSLKLFLQNRNKMV
ncbi:MAG: DUF58 domain-containing protein [Candidatus Cloacimonetes bacterium]|nr:DUF58 domain-containing protein [Candidatus Cloacimonadota bacterium]